MSDDFYVIPRDVLFRPDCVYGEDGRLLSSPEGVSCDVEWHRRIEAAAKRTCVHDYYSQPEGSCAECGESWITTAALRMRNGR